MNKKLKVGILAGSLSLVVIGGTTLLVTNLINKDGLPATDNTNPLNRGDNYTRFDLSSYVSRDSNLKSVAKETIEDEKITKYIDEDALRSYLSTEFRNILKSIDKFSSKYDQYQFTFNYKLQDHNTNLLLDVVWNLPNSSYYYYDQLEISLV